jgi:TatD DNase family protein
MENKIPYTNIHTHHVSTANEISIRNLQPSTYVKDVLCSVGIHPWYIQENTIETDMNLLSTIAAEKNVLAIGECGLDMLIETAFAVQEKVFIEQIKIAEAIQKPLIIHCVKAFDSLIRIKKEYKVSVPMIVHGYNNNPQIAKQLLKNGFYFSFGKALLKSESNASKVMVELPMDKLFLETDDAAILKKCLWYE